MKILFLNRIDAFDKMGGDTIQMLKTKEELEKCNITVDELLGPQNITVYKNYDIIHIFNIQTDKFCFKEVQKIKKVKKTVVISPIWWDFEENIECDEEKKKLIKRLLGKRIVSKIKRYKLNIRYKRMEKILDYSRCILPNSLLEIDSLKRCFKFDFSKCKVIYNGISNEFISSDEIRDRNYALQVGRIEPVKNTLYTIKACKELNIPLIVIGKIADENYYKKCVKEAEHTDIRFLNTMKHTDLINIYKNAKLHILPSFRETPGLVSLEAGVLGCNIVSTEIGSAKEYFGDLVSYCNPFSYDCVKKCISTEWKRENSGKLKTHIINNFTWEIAAKNTLEAYKKCIE